jgi:hypothetical protein
MSLDVLEILSSKVVASQNCSEQSELAEREELCLLVICDCMFITLNHI